MRLELDLNGIRALIECKDADELATVIAAIPDVIKTLPKATRASVARSEETSVANETAGEGENERAYKAKFGGTRLRQSMIDSLGLTGTRDEMFKQLLDGRLNGRILSTPTGFKLGNGSSADVQGAQFSGEVDADFVPEDD